MATVLIKSTRKRVHAGGFGLVRKVGKLSSENNVELRYEGRVRLTRYGMLHRAETAGEGSDGRNRRSCYSEWKMSSFS